MNKQEFSELYKLKDFYDKRSNEELLQSFKNWRPSCIHNNELEGKVVRNLILKRMGSDISMFRDIEAEVFVNRDHLD